MKRDQNAFQRWLTAQRCSPSPIQEVIGSAVRCSESAYTARNVETLNSLLVILFIGDQGGCSKEDDRRSVAHAVLDVFLDGQIAARKGGTRA
jgi:hypothetical protein